MHKFLNSVRKRYIVLAIWCISVCVQILGNLFFPSCFFSKYEFLWGNFNDHKNISCHPFRISNSSNV